MNFKIKPFIFTLLKENSIYLAADLLLLMLIGFIIWLAINNSYQSNKKIQALTTEIKPLDDRMTLLSSTSLNDQDMKDDIQLLNRLIPNSEDYFSILYSLEKLSQETGFNITDYTINLSSSNASKLQMTITGVGDSKTFMKFLQNYNFGGGRLITSDKIELTPQISGLIKMDLTFYNQKVNTTNNPATQYNQQSIANLTALKNRLQFSFKASTTEGQLDFSYPRKANPF